MADYIVTGPDGAKYKLTADSDEAVQHAVSQMFGGSGGGGEKKSAVPAQGRSDALAGAVASGATFGTADELGATVRAALPEFSNWMMSGPPLQRDESIGGSPKAQTVSNAPTYDQRRDEELARTRSQLEANKAAYPALMTAGEIGGNVLGTAALSMVPGARALVTGGGASGIVANTARGAATGALLGGAQGFAEGEGGFANRAGNAVLPALLGGAVGGVAPTLAKGAGYVYDRAAPKLLRYLADKGENYVPRVQPQSLSAAAPDGTAGIAAAGPITDAVDAARSAADGIEKRLTDSMTRRLAPGETPKQVMADKVRGVFGAAAQGADNIDEQVANKYLAQILRGRNSIDATEAAINRPGGDWMIADANKATKRAAFSTQANSDDAAQLMAGRFSERNQRAGTTFIDEGGVPGAPDASKAEAYLSAYKTAEGAKIYDPVLRGGRSLNVSEEMNSLTGSRPAIQKAFETVDRWAAENGRTLTTAERAHMVKQALNANADAMFQTGTAVNRNMVGNTASEWEQALWKANPEIKAADEAYAKIAGLHDDWFKRGQAFAARGTGEKATASSPEAIAEHIRGATPEQMQAFRAGAASEIRRLASDGGKATRRLASAMGEGEAMRARLGEIFGQNEAGRIIGSGNARLAQAETYTDVMRGSPTAERIAALGRDADLMPPTVRSGGDLAQVMSWIKDTAAKLDTPTAAARQRLADILTTMNKEEQKAYLAAVRRFVEQQKQSTFKPGVAGSAAAAAAPNQ